ncbi:hypothetical protein POM88_049619 [Heracleum sosnowskyi]|uniref:Uncharacterized protein n=1 Tax=Heracleum sosnowskyi TaxID=360622 RepID=A0AAD8GXC5_9APIA|nr:hypothetical protein POM88_049619 [Heracleum sosnowskyi]
MLCGSIGFENRRDNEFNSFMEGLKEAFYRTPVLQAPIVQQLNQRRQDNNYHSEVFLADFEDNAMTIYLAEYGARNFKDMVIMEEPFGRIEELWHLEMGLDPEQDDEVDGDVVEEADEVNQVLMTEDVDVQCLHVLAAASGCEEAGIEGWR